MIRGPQRNGGGRPLGFSNRVGKHVVMEKEPASVYKADYVRLEPAILALLVERPQQKRSIASILGVVEASLSELMTKMRRQQKIKLIGMTSGARLWALADYVAPRQIVHGKREPMPVNVTKASTLRAPHERPPSQTVSKQQSWWCEAPRADWQREVDAHELRMRSARIAHYINPVSREYGL